MAVLHLWFPSHLNSHPTSLAITHCRVHHTLPGHQPNLRPWGCSILQHLSSKRSFQARFQTMIFSHTAGALTKFFSKMSPTLCYRIQVIQQGAKKASPKFRGRAGRLPKMSTNGSESTAAASTKWALQSCREQSTACGITMLERISVMSLWKTKIIRRIVDVNLELELSELSSWFRLWHEEQTWIIYRQWHSYCQ